MKPYFWSQIVHTILSHFSPCYTMRFILTLFTWDLGININESDTQREMGRGGTQV